MIHAICFASGALTGVIGLCFIAALAKARSGQRDEYGQ